LFVATVPVEFVLDVSLWTGGHKDLESRHLGNFAGKESRYGFSTRSFTLIQRVDDYSKGVTLGQRRSQWFGNEGIELLPKIMLRGIRVFLQRVVDAFSKGSIVSGELTSEGREKKSRGLSALLVPRDEETSSKGTYPDRSPCYRFGDGRFPNASDAI
jgi:hypothetical protein